jgi:hypothetical protein
MLSKRLDDLSDVGTFVLDSTAASRANGRNGRSRRVAIGFWRISCKLLDINIPDKIEIEVKFMVFPALLNMRGGMGVKASSQPFKVEVWRTSHIRYSPRNI